MFNKLIIAVLTLGLILTFSSAAISSDNLGAEKDVPLSTVHQPKAQLTETGARSVLQERALVPGGRFSGTLTSPPTNYACESAPAFDTAGGLCYFWQLPAELDEMLYSYPEPENQACTLQVAWIYMYGGGTVGTPGAQITVYENNHGVPGAVLFTTQGVFGTDFSDGWNPITIPNIVVSGGYFLGVAPVITNAGDQLALLSDCGDLTGGGVVRVGANYYLFGYGPGFYSDRCCADIPYTSCYTQMWIDDWAYLFGIPNATNCRDGIGVRFSVAGPETLKVAYVGLSNYFETDDGSVLVDVNVYDAPGGVPTGAPLATVHLTTMAEKYPASGYAVADFSSLNLIMRNDFIIAAEVVGYNPGMQTTLYADDYPNSVSYNRAYVHFPAPNACYPGVEGWYFWGDVFAGNVPNFDILVDLCRDQYAQCSWATQAASGPYGAAYMTATGSAKAFAEQFNTGGLKCRVEQFTWMFDWDVEGCGIKFMLLNDHSGLPGDTVWQTDVNPYTGPYYPSSAVITVPDVPEAYMSGTYYIGVAGIWNDASETILNIYDDYSGSASYLYALRPAFWPPTGWGNVAPWYGKNYNEIASVYTCCVPLAEWTCAPGEDWPDMGKNFVRDGHSRSGLGNAACNLTKAWQYNNFSTSNTGFANSPVIYKDTVIYYMGDKLVALDINTGAQIWVRPFDGFEIGAGSSSTPTVVDGVIYTGGGNAKSFSAIKVTDGSTIWTRNFSTHSNHFVTFAPSVMVDAAGTPVVVYSDDNGWLYAVNAATGVLFPGWAVNPVKMTTAIVRGVSYDGSKIFVGTNKTSVNGDIFALDPATGTTLWQLSLAGGLKGASVVPAKDFGGLEGFVNAISVDPTQSVLYTASWYDIADNTTPVQDGGVLYAIGTSDGSVKWAVRCNNGGGGYSMPNIDTKNVIHNSWSYWTNAAAIYGPGAFNRATGSVAWKANVTYPLPYANDFVLMEGALSCETGVSDIYVSQSRSNFVKFFNADNGAQMFHRRWVATANGVAFYRAGHQVGPVMDEGHLILTWRNKMVCLATTATDRPRLDLPNYTIDKPLEFGSPDHSVVPFGPAITNSGCAPLTIDSVVLSTTSNNSTPLASVIAGTSSARLTRLTSSHFNPKTDQQWMTLSDDMTTSEQTRAFSTQNAAYAPPSYVYGVITPTPGTMLAPGDTIPIVLDINGPVITRGVHSFYARVWTDDPDYFIDSARGGYGAPANAAYAAPQILMNLIGGCLYSSVPLTFGVGDANFQIVWNSGMTGNGDSANAQINSKAELYQGSLIYGVGHYRIAFNTRSWHSGETEQWKSLLADPNCFDQGCPPTLTEDVLLGQISTDNGASYTPVYGNVVSMAYVDSVQNMGTYDTLGNLTAWSWNWPQNPTLHDTPEPPYDDTLTIGFHSCTKVVGVSDVAELGDFYVVRNAITSRNNVTIPGLYMSEVMDYDVGPSNLRDVAGYDAAHSLGFMYDCGSPVNAWGQIKVPFGCGYAPLLGVITLASGQSLYPDTNPFLDSAYIWMKKTGQNFQQGTSGCSADPDDRAMWTNFQVADIPPTDTVVYAFARFEKTLANANDASNYFELANTINKWCGFGRGDVNNDGKVDLVDIVFMINYVTGTGQPGPYPFLHLGDVNGDEAVNAGDVTYLKDFYFNFGPCPVGKWTF